MKRSMCSILSVSVFLVLFCMGNAMAENKALVLVGVLEDQALAGSGLTSCIEAIKEGLKSENIPADILFSNLDETQGEAVVKAEAKKTIEKIRQIKPGVLIVLNDYDIKYVATQIDDIPVVAAYFFSAPQMLGLPKPNITGITRGSYAPDMWKMANQLTGGKTVGMLSKKSFAMEGIRKAMFARAAALEQASGVKFSEMYLCDTFEEWQNQVKNWSEDLMYIIDTSRLNDGDREVMPEETVKWTVENTKVPIFAVNEYDVRYGALFSIVTSDASWGHQAVQMAKKILAGTPVSEIPMETVNKGSLLVNAKTAEKLKVDIPYEILESADHIYE